MKGKELSKIGDVSKLQEMVEALWILLDDIDILDDACKSNDESFRLLARDVQKKRYSILESDGYKLYDAKVDKVD